MPTKTGIPSLQFTFSFPTPPPELEDIGEKWFEQTAKGFGAVELIATNENGQTSYCATFTDATAMASYMNGLKRQFPFLRENIDNSFLAEIRRHEEEKKGR